MSPDGTFPGMMVVSHSGIEVSEHNQFVGCGHSRDKGVEFFVEFVFNVVWGFYLFIIFFIDSKILIQFMTCFLKCNKVT